MNKEKRNGRFSKFLVEHGDPTEVIDMITGGMPLAERQRLFHKWMNKVHTRLLAVERLGQAL